MKRPAHSLQAPHPGTERSWVRGSSERGSYTDRLHARYGIGFGIGRVGEMWSFKDDRKRRKEEERVRGRYR